MNYSKLLHPPPLHPLNPLNNLRNTDLSKFLKYFRVVFEIIKVEVR